MNTKITIESKKEILVSIIITCYNHEKYLVECLKSVFTQNYENFEVIIRDDGSTDKSVELIQSFLDDSNNTFSKPCFFEHGVNIGLVKSLNSILKKAKGEIIIFCSTDDLFLENRISKAVEIHLQYPNIEFVAFNAIVIDDIGTVIHPTFYHQYTKNSEIEIYESLNYKKTIGTHFGGFGITIKKNFLKQLNFQLPETLSFEDGYMSFLALINNGAIKVNSIFMKYRRATNSLSRGNTSLNQSEILTNEKKFLKLFLSLDEHKLMYIMDNCSTNSIVLSNKNNIINLLKQKILCLKIKISILENRKKIFIWLNLLWLILIGVKSRYTIKILVISFFNQTLINQMVKDNKNRSKIL